ncbi:KfrB domain-containing protein [Achromobacter kerstersii]
MKISDWKTKVQALFRPARHDHAPVSNGPRTFAASADRKPVAHGAGLEQFVHAPSLEDAVVDPRYLSPDPYHDDLERVAAEALKRWDGKSVRDIDTERFYDHSHLETHTALQASVPEQARAEFWNPAPKEPAYRSSITVLAVDQLGEALVKEYVVDDSRNAEGWSYSVMSADRAAQLLRDYGAAADLKLDVADDLWDGSLPVQPAEIGATYRGQIVSIHGDIACQIVGDEIAIEHRIGTLAISDPQQYVGKEVEISYPCGRVGLVRQVDTLAMATTALEKAGAEKTSAALER